MSMIGCSENSRSIGTCQFSMLLYQCSRWPILLCAVGRYYIPDKVHNVMPVTSSCFGEPSTIVLFIRLVHVIAVCDVRQRSTRKCGPIATVVLSPLPLPSPPLLFFLVILRLLLCLGLHQEGCSFLHGLSCQHLLITPTVFI